MALALLPKELLDMIIVNDIPEGLESLTLTCKEFHALCTPFLPRHNLLRSQFYDFTYAYESFHDDPFFIKCAFDLIAYIAVDPTIARYIVKAEFGRDSFYLKGRPRDFNPDVRPEDFKIDGRIDVRTCIQNLLASSPYLKAAGLDWKEYWTAIDDEIENRTYSQHAAAFLLTLLPNAQEFSLPRRWTTLATTDKLIDAVIRKSRQPLPSKNTPSLARMTKLRTSETYGPHDKMNSTLVAPFLALPSLRYFYGTSCVPTITSPDPDYDQGHELAESFYPTFRSDTMEAIEMMASCINAAGIATFLKQVPCLRSLQYGHWPKEETDKCWDICAFISAIGLAVGHSLEELSISFHKLPDSIAPGTISMQEFRKLRQLEIPLEAAVCQLSSEKNSPIANLLGALHLDRDTRHSLLSTLTPPSVARLSIISSGTDAHVPALEAMFCDFKDTKAHSVPKLEEIYLTLSCPASPSAGEKYKEVCKKVKGTCEKAGVACTLKGWGSSTRFTWLGDEQDAV